MSAIEAKDDAKQEEETSEVPQMTLLDITETPSDDNPSSIPIAKFIDDLDAFVDSFTPPAPAELLIGAYTELLAKYKSVEANLTNKHRNLSQKVPELNQSLTLVKSLQRKKEENETPVVTRYALADNIYAKAELDLATADDAGVVYLWLGANVMLEYTYQEAIDFLTTNVEDAERELKQVKKDLGTVKEQIVTSEVSTNRIYNWSVLRERTVKTAAAKSATKTETSSNTS